jgi:hypothetical protein
MQWKRNPSNLDFMLLLEFFNTPGNEVAPWSDVIGEDFDNDGFAHDSSWMRVCYINCYDSLFIE